MSSALDGDTMRTLDEGRRTAGAMLRAAQKDLQKVFIVFLVGFLGAFYALRLYVWPFFQSVTRARLSQEASNEVVIIAQTPFDVILLQAKISLVVGVIFALPIFLYFARDGLRARGAWPQAPIARWKLASLGLLSLTLFSLGLVYGYYVFFPIMFEFLANNAISAGFEPTYSIVMWAEFIFFLTLSFGLAAQMPLAITGLSYSGIVPYETFRDKWRYAVVAIFVFGAIFSPPDPFTQIMWAIPLLVLYGFSLYLAQVVVMAKRGTGGLDVGGTARDHWNVLLGAFAVGAAATYLYYSRQLRTVVNDALAGVGSSYRVLPIGEWLTFSETATLALVATAVGLVGLVVALLVLTYRDLSDQGRAGGGEYGDPLALDVAGLDAAGVRAAPAEVFAELSESEAVSLAGDALDAGDHEKAQAILDRFDETHEAALAPGHATDDAAATAGGAGTSTGGGGAPAASSFVMDGSGGTLATFRRGRRRVDWGLRLRRKWNVALAAALLAFGAVYAYGAYGGAAYLNRAVLGPFDLGVSAVPLERLLGLPLQQAALVAGAAVAAAVLLVLGLGYYVWRSFRAATNPAAIDVSALSAAEVRAAPVETFATMTEATADAAAERALTVGDREKAQAIVDRHEGAEAEMAAREEASEADVPAEPGSIGDRATRASGTFLSEFTDGERDEDDIGGYYTDIAFILDSITSRTFRIVAVFMGVLASVFTWLYVGGLGDVREDFLSRLPVGVRPEQMNVVALHPVEALVFEVKFSTLVAAATTLPMVAYYAWPALRERGFVRGRRQVIFGWVLLLFAGLIGGFYLGYSFVAPTVISYLVADAVQANMVISYRISDFFWLIFYTTVGIGLLADIPVLMLLFNTAGVPYQAMRRRWREVTVGIMTFAALFTPADMVSMIAVTIPLMLAYGAGLGLLFLVTFGGRRNLAKPLTSRV